MAEKRVALTAILVKLMDQKKERQEELTSRLKEMEEHKGEEHDNYWLIQYQKLLDSKPKVIKNCLIQKLRIRNGIKIQCGQYKHFILTL